MTNPIDEAIRVLRDNYDNAAKFAAIASALEALHPPAEKRGEADICSGCDSPLVKCQPLWAEQKKCCPDCSHAPGFKESGVAPSPLPASLPPGARYDVGGGTSGHFPDGARFNDGRYLGRVIRDDGTTRDDAHVTAAAIDWDHYRRRWSDGDRLGDVATDADLAAVLAAMPEERLRLLILSGACGPLLHKLYPKAADYESMKRRAEAAEERAAQAERERDEARARVAELEGAFRGKRPVCSSCGINDHTMPSKVAGFFCSRCGKGSIPLAAELEGAK